MADEKCAECGKVGLVYGSPIRRCIDCCEKREKVRQETWEREERMRNNPAVAAALEDLADDPPKEPADPPKKKGQLRRYTDDQLRTALVGSTTWKGVAKQLGVKDQRGVSKRAQELGLELENPSPSSKGGSVGGRGDGQSSGQLGKQSPHGPPQPDNHPWKKGIYVPPDLAMTARGHNSGGHCPG